MSRHIILHERGLALTTRLVLVVCVLGVLATPEASLSVSYENSSRATFSPALSQSSEPRSGPATSYNSGSAASSDEEMPIVGDNALDYVSADNVLDDTVPPVISLYGYSTMTIEAGTSFWEPGYSAYDDQDGDLTWYVTVSGWVNSYALGTYTLRYNVRDSSGNYAEEKRRTVYVVDTTPPKITLFGDNPFELEVGTTYYEPGYRATDNYDGDLTWYVAVTGYVSSYDLGTCTLRYNVSDSSGNPADEEVRTVRVVDTSQPVIHLLGENEVVLEVGTWYTDPGYTATDNYDGDITSHVWVVGSVDHNYLGNYTLTYTVSDSSGNPAEEKKRIVRVVDTTRPVIRLLGDDTAVLEVGTWYTDPGYTATDNYDGDITSHVWVVGSVDHNYLGNYTLTYTVSDSSGNPADEEVRTVRVVDTTQPVIHLLGENEVVLEVGIWYADPGYTATDNCDGDITSHVWVVGSVDHNYLGNYTLTYTVSDSSGNPAEEKTRIVRVVDTTPPVITLRGRDSMKLKLGTPFVEPGFTTSDNYDGDISANVRVSGSVNHMWAGSYVLRYAVSDSSGNPALERVRTVEVVDWELSLQVSQVSDVQTGQIAVSYIVEHSEGVPCSVAIEFTPDGGASWRPASHGLGGDGLMKLSSSPAGVAHTFIWDSVTDLGGTAREESVEVQITVSDEDFSSDPATTGPFSLDNTFEDADNDNLPDDWERRIADFDGDDDIVSPADVNPNADFDGDGKTNCEEYLAGTDPADAASVFSAQLQKGSYSVSWPSVQGKFYIVYFCEQPGGEWTPMSEEMPGDGAGQLTLEDATTAAGLGFFRVAVY